MIRVLHVIGAMDRAGAETFLMNTYRAIDRAQIQFDFLVHESRTCDYDREIIDLGGRIYRIQRPSAANLLTGYRAACRNFFRAHPEYTIVHGHMGSSAAVYLQEARSAGCFTIAHSHAQNFLTGALGAEFSLASHPTRYVADYFLACSHEAGLDRFGKRIVESPRFRVIPNGICADDFSCNGKIHELAKTAFGLDGRPVFLHVGRLAPEKNHRFLFQVFALILQSLPQSVLLLAGAGPLQAELEQYASHLGIRESVAFLGSVDIIPQLLDASDVFIMPSTKEGFTISLIEAQASGLPCLCSNGVPSSSCVSPQVARLSLDDDPMLWANTALDAYRKTLDEPRRDGTRYILDAGFDSASVARTLCKLYTDIADACACETRSIT